MLGPPHPCDASASAQAQSAQGQAGETGSWPLRGRTGTRSVPRPAWVRSAHVRLTPCKRGPLCHVQESLTPKNARVKAEIDAEEVSKDISAAERARKRQQDAARQAARLEAKHKAVAMAKAQAAKDMKKLRSQRKAAQTKARIVAKRRELLAKAEAAKKQQREEADALTLVQQDKPQKVSCAMRRVVRHVAHTVWLCAEQASAQPREAPQQRQES